MDLPPRLLECRVACSDRDKLMIFEPVPEAGGNNELTSPTGQTSRARGRAKAMGSGEVKSW